MEGWQRELIAAAFAGFAGFVAYLQGFSRKVDRPAWDWLGCGIRVFTAVFAGWLAFLLLVDRILNENLLHAAVALTGWGGADAITFFYQIFQDVIRRIAAGFTPPPKDGA